MYVCMCLCVALCFHVSVCLFAFVCAVIVMVCLETLLAPTENCCRVFQLKVSASVSGCGLSSFQLLLKAPLCLNELLTLAPNQYQPNSLKNHRWNWPHCSVLSVVCDQCVCVCVSVIAASLPFLLGLRPESSVMVEYLLSFMMEGEF